MEEIQDIILSPQVRKGSGLFSIPVSLLKSLNSIIVKHLDILYNLSFSSGTVPDSFKMSFLFTSLVFHHLYQTIDQYPFLSIFNQILEKLMTNRVLKTLCLPKLLLNDLMSCCQQSQG